MNKTIKLCIVFACFLILIGSVYAGYRWVYSDVITTTVEDYTLTISGPTSATLYKIITFSGFLTDDKGAVPDKTIQLFKNGSLVASNTTQSDGSYIINYNVSQLGPLDFQTGYEVS